MNSLERVVTTLQFKEADRVPVYPIVNSISRNTLGIDYEEWTKDIDKCADSIIKITEELDLDVITSLVDLSIEAADWGQEIIYFDDKAACPNHENSLIKSVEDYAKLKRINPRETPRMKGHIELCKKLMEKKGHEKPVVAFVFAPLGILAMLRGMNELLMDIIMHPEEVHKALKEITATINDLCDALMEVGVHGIMFDTLFGSETIMSEQMWDDFEGVYIEEISNRVHAKECLVMIHNCGEGPYFDAHIKRMKPAAFSFLHYPSGCSSYAEMSEKYDKKLTLIGCIDPGWIMSASVDDIKEEAKKEIDTFSKGGGFILATGCEFPASLGYEKAHAIVEVAKTYGVYNNLKTNNPKDEKVG